jgi:hypothetical protein
MDPVLGAAEPRPANLRETILFNDCRYPVLKNQSKPNSSSNYGNMTYYEPAGF